MTRVPCSCTAGGYDVPDGCPTLDEIAEALVDHLAEHHEPLALPPLGLDLVGPDIVPAAAPIRRPAHDLCKVCLRAMPCPNHARAQVAA